MDPLVSVGDLSDYLGRPVDPARGALAVAGASGVVRNHCQWDISQELGATFMVSGSGSRVLGLPTLHMTAVLSVTVDGDPVDPADYRWSYRGQLYRSAQPWPRWAIVNVVADTGYVDIPDVIKIVTLSVAARQLSNPEALKSSTVGAVQRTYATPDLHTLELALLDTFRLS